MTFHLGVKVTQNIALYLAHHETNAPTNFEIATSSGFGEDGLTRKCII